MDEDEKDKKRMREAEEAIRLAVARDIEALRKEAKTEEAIRLAVARDIEALRKEAKTKLEEADRLEKLLAMYPNVRKHTGRWNKVAYYSKDVNALVTRYDMRHNCGCCNDSPLEVWPYLETVAGKVYSDPPMFQVGEREPFYGGDRPHKGWEKMMLDAEIPMSIIETISLHFRSEAEEVKG